LRVFSNVNPYGKSRHWRLGDRFERTAQHFVAYLPAPLPGAAWVMKAIGATKGYRTRYDHMMLALHDAMKMDSDFQRTTVQNEFHFPPGSTWLVFTDMVAHASMSGQHLFEQTFYVPVRAMADASKAPLRVLERLTGRVLA
jgi:hypothetical protein